MANLTQAQLQALRTDVDANFPLLGDAEVAAQYNLVASPDFWVWRSFVEDATIYETTTPAPDNTVWSWSIYIARSQAEREAWRQMVNMKGGINPSLTNVRQGIQDIFSGAGGTAQRAHLLVLSRRLATRGEKVLAAGTGSTASPATMSYEGEITPVHIAEARALP